MKRKLSLTSSVITELKKGACQANDPLWLTLWVKGASQRTNQAKGQRLKDNDR
jgi:hypothetical protein